MLFPAKNRKKQGEVLHTEKSLYPVLHVTDCLNDYKKDLIGKEVESLFELNMVGSSRSLGILFPILTTLPGNLPKCGRALRRRFRRRKER